MNKPAPKKAHGHMITICVIYLRGNSLCKLKIFPAEWKKANVVPVYKKRDHMLKTTDWYPFFQCSAKYLKELFITLRLNTF